MQLPLEPLEFHFNYSTEAIQRINTFYVQFFEAYMMLALLQIRFYMFAHNLIISKFPLQIDVLDLFAQSLL